MSQATLRVSFAGPLVTFQDAGRVGHMRFGVAASGPMDRLSHAAANVALGNPAQATAVEISMGGLILECLSGALSLAVAGGDFSIDRAGDRLSSWTTFALEQGEKLTIRPGKSGSWAYLAFAGNVQTPKWLGHSATHSTSGFGGGQLHAGQLLQVSDTQLREERHGDILRPDFVEAGSHCRVVLGPQDKYFSSAALAAFHTQEFALTDAYDRMGVRLSGPKLDLSGALSIPSEPIVRGSVQVAGDGVATVLLADHQTTGGYPKIATVLADDLDRLCQMRARDPLHFSAVSPADAIKFARDSAEKRDIYLAEIAFPKGTLEQRLMRENLISGVVAIDA